MQSHALDDRSRASGASPPHLRKILGRLLKRLCSLLKTLGRLKADDERTQKNTKQTPKHFQYMLATRATKQRVQLILWASCLWAKRQQANGALLFYSRKRVDWYFRKNVHIVCCIFVGSAMWSADKIGRAQRPACCQELNMKVGKWTIIRQARDS